jgi:uncharacterized protein YcbK (DUF882 family)
MIIQNGVNYYGVINKCKAIAESIDSITPFTVTSGERSVEYNKQAGGAKNSAHIGGRAVDGFCKDWHCVKIAAHIATHFPDVKGIGIDVYRNCIHFDYMDRGAIGITYWVYDRNGRAV